MGVQGKRPRAGGGSVRVSVSVMFEYLECVDFLHFAFRGIKFEALLLRTMSTVRQR